MVISHIKHFFYTFCVALLLLPHLVLAVSSEFVFNPHNIISDEEIEDYTSMSPREIEQFLRDYNSSLAGKTMLNYEGVPKKASTIIWEAAQESKVNPKLLLTTLQKEQSLIEDPVASTKRLERAMGYRCPDGGSCHPNVLHFGKQVDGAAWQFRQYLDRPTDWNFRAGEQYEVSGELVIPQNNATAGLYNYTPHIAGNRSFAKLWQRYWGVRFPDRTLVKSADSPHVYLLQDGLRRRIATYGVLISRFDPDKIVTASDRVVQGYPLGPEIKFSNYSLLRTPQDKIYLVVDDQLRHITSPEVFRQIGFNWEEIEDAEIADLAGYDEGEPVTLESAYPTGALLQAVDSSDIYYVENGERHIILNPVIQNMRFPNKRVTTVAQDVLTSYSDGAPIYLPNGELVKSPHDPRVYVISGTQRREIPNETVFAKYNWKWDNVTVVPTSVLELHKLSDPIE